MARNDPRAVDRLIERILDAQPADWPAQETPPAGAEREFEALQTLSDIARAFRRFDAPTRATRAPALFQWGHLAVQEKIADGGSSEVYRAWDAGLGTHVALKLLRPDAGAPRARVFLDEARRLARVRHRNVLSVYGAAVHDGRPGLWCEWIDGHSLARQVGEHGALGADEAVVLGIALCRALGAVHAAGLLHGDVKPDNVLRERGGRIVLADLGAGGEPAAVNASLRSAATPAWLAPEVLQGALRTPQQDLYALGGVLQYVLSARVPDPSRPGADLGHADLPAPLREVIERARAADPRLRYADAGGMQRALAACIDGHREAATPPPVRVRRRLAFAAAGVFALAAIAAGAWWLRPPLPPLQAQVELLRHRGDVSEAIADGTPIVLGDRLSFAVSGTRPLWLYAYNADDRGALQRLFPLDGLEASNPLPPGQRTEIPGRWQGRAMRFEVSSSATAEDFLLVAADAPIERLEAVAGEPAITDAEVHARGTARVVPATSGLPGTRLDALAAELAAGPGAPRLWRFRLPHRESGATREP